MTTRSPIEHRTADIHIEASPQQVYDVISDLNRMAEWSDNVDRVDFIEGYRETAEGAKFQIHEGGGILGTTKECRIASSRRGEQLAWDVVDGEQSVSRWRYDLEPEGEGTRLYESVEIFHAPLTSKVAWLLQGGQENRFEKVEGDMQHNLERIKQTVENEVPAAVS